MIGKYVPKLGIFYLDELSMTSCRDATGMMVIGLGESSLNGSARLMIITGLWQPQPKDAGKLSLNPGFQLISTSNEKSLSCFSIFFGLRCYIQLLSNIVGILTFHSGNPWKSHLRSSNLQYKGTVLLI